MLVFLLLAMAVWSWGQATTSLRGAVSDVSGAFVPEATVTLSNTATQYARSATTTANGEY